MRFLLALLIALSSGIWGKELRIVFIDVEGGQATLLVSPAGESMLIDAGWPGNEGRDAIRIKAAMKKMGLKKLDYFVNSHYHLDHVGGIQDLAQRVEIGTFVDKGPNSETSAQAARLSKMWEEAAAKGKRITLKPGDKLPIKGMDVTVVSADGKVIEQALAGAGGKVSACVDSPMAEEDKTENGRSMGVVVQWKNFRFLNLSDLTRDRERLLVCPENKLGKIDLFLSSHHGFDSSNFPPLVAAIQPKVTVVNNGARKGGILSVIKLLKENPGNEDVWQLHFAVSGAKEGNTTDPFIANVYENQADRGDYLLARVAEDGTITIENSRNKFLKSYKR
jgi:competence protein ComEC